MKKIIAIAGIVGMLLSAPSANATFVNSWSYTQTSVWNTAIFARSGSADITGIAGSPTANLFNSNNSLSHVDTSLLSWGYDDGTSTPNILPTDGGGDAAKARSAMAITGSPAMGFVDTNSFPAATVSLTHYNNPISSAFYSLKSATLDTTLHFTAIDPSIPGSHSIGDTTYHISFKETPNLGNTVCDSSTDGSGNPIGVVTDCDLFVISLTDLSDSHLIFDGVTYTIGLYAPQLGQLSVAQCRAAGADDICFGAQTRESAMTKLDFGIYVTADVPVPEPTPIALLGLGIFALYSARSRKNR